MHLIRKPVLLLLTMVLLVLAGSAALAQEAAEAVQESKPETVPELRNKASQAYYKKDYASFVAAMEKLHQMRPYNSEYMYRLSLAYALAERKTEAYNLMLAMQRQGLAYDFNKTVDSKNIRGTEVYTYLNDLMIGAGKPWGGAQPVFDLPADVLLAEAIAWNAAGKHFLVGTVTDGRILKVDLEGKVETLVQPSAENGLWGVFDIKIDAARKVFWVSSASVSQYQGYTQANKGSTGLFKFELGSGKLLAHYTLPEDGQPHSLANMVVAANGDVYVADAARPIVFLLRHDSDAIKPFVASPSFISIRGMALSPDSERLYVADHELGIMVADLKSNRSQALQVPPSLNLGGIDGLYFWGDKFLVAIQNGISPQRVMRFELDDAGTAVAKVRALQVAHEDFDLPTFGDVVDGNLYFYANSHWPVIGAKGRPLAGAKPAPVKVLKLPLESGEDVVNLENALLQEQMKRIQERNNPPQLLKRDSDSGGAASGQN